MIDGQMDELFPSGCLSPPASEVVRIPLLDLTAQYRHHPARARRPPCSAYWPAELILGPEVAAFEREIAAYLGTPHAIGVSNGTDALILALMALGIGPGDEVVTPAYSFFATRRPSSAAARAPSSSTWDRSDDADGHRPGAGAIGPRTRAFCVVHLFGRCCPVRPLRAAAPQLPVIEDAAQAIGAELDGVRAGALGQVGCFSFFPSKNLGCLGDGGLVTTADATLATQVRALRVHGQAEGRRQRRTFDRRQLPARCAPGRGGIATVEAASPRSLDRAAQRQRRTLPGALRRGSTPGVAPGGDPAPGADRDVHNQFVIRVTHATAMRCANTSQRAASVRGCTIPRPLHLQPALAHLGHRAGDFPTPSGRPRPASRCRVSRAPPPPSRRSSRRSPRTALQRRGSVEGR